MNRKYLDKLGIKEVDTPQGWLPDDERQVRWQKEREECGFDSRETWNLDYTFMLWLYERLSMFNDVHCINTLCHSFEFEGEIITLQDCIDRMLDGAKICLIKPYDNERSEEEQKKINDVVKIFALCFWCLWW